MSQTCTLGIDIGTTGVKVVGVSADGRVICTTRRNLTVDVPEPGTAVQDVHDVGVAVEETLVEALQWVHKQGLRVGQIGFSAAMHSLLCVDEHGAPLSPAITWMDTRASQEAADLWNHPEGPSVYAVTGTPIHPMSPLPKLMHLRKNNPDLFSRTTKFVSLKEWIWHRWFGVWEVDAAMAGATGMYSLANEDWSEDALRLAGVDASKLSVVVPTTHVRNGIRTASILATGLSPGTPFNIGASDGVLANLGVGALSPDATVITIGTSCAIRRTVPKAWTDVQTRSFCYVMDKHRFVVGGPSNSGGVVTDWVLRKAMGLSRDDDSSRYAELMEEAGGVDVDGLMCIPYLSGERAPIWNPEATMSLVGLELGHDQRHIVRATVEGILLNARWIADALHDALGKPSYLLASGGLLDVPWVKQLAADVFGVKVITTSSADASALGAIVLAEIATGRITWEQAQERLTQIQMHHGDGERQRPNQAQTVKTQDVVTPNANAADQYNVKFARFQRLANLLNEVEPTC